jgi:hypothetical protein
MTEVEDVGYGRRNGNARSLLFLPAKVQMQIHPMPSNPTVQMLILNAELPETHALPSL